MTEAATKVVDPPKSEAPLYRLLQPFYVDDVLIDSETVTRNGPEATVIEFHGIPNEAMEPLNNAARAQMEKLFQRIAAGNRQAGRAALAATPAIGDLAAEAMAARPREMPTRVDGVPPMSGTLYEGSKFRQPGEKAPSVKIIEAAEHIPLRPRKIMGTIVKEESILTGQGT